jgi:hypothetical protein
VANTTSMMEWPEFATVNSDNGSIHQCVRLRLGYSRQPTTLAREMVRIREISSHRLQRIKGIVEIGEPSSIASEAHGSILRQYDNDCVYKQIRGERGHRL